MGLTAVQQAITGALATYVYPGGYDSTKLGLGPGMQQVNDSGNEGKWAGPFDVKLARPVEVGSLMPEFEPAQQVIPWSSDIDWIFFSDQAAAGVTRRVDLWTFTKSTRAWARKGHVVGTMPTATNHTIRGLAVSYEKYITGTVAINNGSASLTGSGTTWSADRIFIGSRIGFGSTDPTQITTWYEISAVGSDTGITLTANFGQANISGSAYVIEDLRVLMATTNATAANGGLYMFAGLRYDLFSAGGGAVPAATTVDKIRAVYWLGDGTAASNTVIQAAAGCTIDARTTWTAQNCYVHDAPAGNSRFSINNFRAAMTVGGTTSGRESGTWTLNTGQQTVTGTVSQIGNLILCTPAHGPRNGVKTLFWVTTTRIYSAATANITSASTTFQSGNATEIPPGSTTTFGATSVLNSIAYDPNSDRFLIFTTGVTSFRHYFTQYREDGGQWDRYILGDLKQINQSTADATAPPIFSGLILAATGTFAANGILYCCTHGLTALTNILYAIPIGADWEFTARSSSRVVFPAMTLTNPAIGQVADLSVIEVVGGATGTNLGYTPDAVRLYYRITGISDNSGTWNLLDNGGANMSGVNLAGATQIQFMAEFRTATLTGLPGRVTGIACVYNDASGDIHYEPCADLSDKTLKHFAWKFRTAFGTTVPALRVTLYNDVTNALLVDDNTTSPTGTFEKSTDGGANWVAWTNADLGASTTTFLRYTPASIADNIQVRAALLLV